MTFAFQIDEAEHVLQQVKDRYLRRWGWETTCNTPGSYWLWRRDFAVEDKERHDRWQEAGPGPYGWPSEPKPYGLITASLDTAVAMTRRCLDEQPEPDGEDE